MNVVYFIGYMSHTVKVVGNIVLLGMFMTHKIDLNSSFGYDVSCSNILYVVFKMC